MEIRTIYKKFQCVECGNQILIKDISKNEIYCRKCGLIHDDSMQETAKEQYKKALIKEIKENEPKLYKEIKKAYENEQKGKRLKRIKMNARNQKKLNEINYLLYGSNTIKPTKIK